ncbi:MAG: serine hydrolase [Oscillospiraceae bacterium]|jgi:CubicO group peptidase (beta-lactamase class C family)|nr:serine hydrolase [Oscillospiraceae bacterium]
MSAFNAETFGVIAEKALKLMNVTGAAVSVIEDGEVVFSGGYGYADIENQAPMTSGTILPIGSSSKAFTASSIMMLQAEKKLDIDKPVRDYMPSFALHDPVASQNATLRDLLCHRTGMPRHDLLWISWSDVTRAEIVEKRLPHLKENKSFRSKWEYNNYMFAAAGLLIEKLTGKTWEEFVSERIFAPLNMTDTSPQTPQEGKPAATLYKTNKETKANEPIAPIGLSAIGPAGSIQSTVDDLAKWVKFNLAKGKAGETELLAADVYANLTKPNIPYQLLPIDVPENVGLGYGLGWFVNSYRGEKMVEHGGNVFGASALIAFMPEKNSGVVVLTNQDSTLATYALAFAAFDQLLGQSGKDWPEFWQEKIDELTKKGEEQLDAFKKDVKPGKPFTHPLDDYAGEYDNPGYGKLEIIKTEDGFDVKLHSETAKMVHKHYDIFYVELHDMPLQGSFKTGFDGAIDSVSIGFEPAAEPVEFKKI